MVLIPNKEYRLAFTNPLIEGGLVNEFNNLNKNGAILLDQIRMPPYFNKLPSLEDAIKLNDAESSVNYDDFGEEETNKLRVRLQHRVNRQPSKYYTKTRKKSIRATWG